MWRKKSFPLTWPPKKTTCLWVSSMVMNGFKISPRDQAMLEVCIVLPKVTITTVASTFETRCLMVCVPCLISWIKKAFIIVSIFYIVLVIMNIVCGSFHGVGAQNVTWWSKIQHQYNHVNWIFFGFLSQFKQQFYDYFDWTIHFSIFAGKKRKTQIPMWLGHQISFSEKLFNLNSN